jgi:phosphopantetheinyl transferase (holo-ACP synthase)
MSQGSCTLPQLKCTCSTAPAATPHIASADEISLINSSADPVVAFLALWVRKEAVVKATGEGISRAGSYSFAHGTPPGWSISMNTM